MNRKKSPKHKHSASPKHKSPTLANNKPKSPKPNKPFIKPTKSIELPTCEDGNVSIDKGGSSDKSNEIVEVGRR